MYRWCLLTLLVSHSVPLTPPSYLKGIGHGVRSQISIQNSLSFLEQAVSECACLKLGTSLLRAVKDSTLQELNGK